MRKAVLYSTVAIIAVHNHPSGNADHSDKDQVMTERLRRSYEILGIQFLDSVVIAAGGKVQITIR